MNTATVSLAELVNRGMNSMHQSINDGAELTPARHQKSAQRQMLALKPNADVERLLKSTNGLVERLTWLPASSSNDVLAMRRYILHSVEYFITELSSER